MTEKESEAEARDREVADLKSSLRAEEERREAAERKHSEAQTSGEQTALDLAALKSAHEQATRTMEESRAAELERVRQEAEATRSTLQQERDQLGLEIDQLRKSATETNEKLESSLKQAEELRQAEPNANQEGELKDALAALSTLEQALVDSQGSFCQGLSKRFKLIHEAEERDELLVQIDQLQKSADSTESTAEVEKVLTDTKSQLETAQKDLASANKDREELRSSQSKLAFLVKDLQAKAALSGKRSPDLTRTSSDASTDGGRISTQSISAKSPPTVPPPSMSLPPLPSGATGQSRSSNSPTPGNRSSNTPSSSRDSTSNTAGSRASTTSISTIDVNIDPRLQKKMEEQDANVSLFTV